MRNETDPKSVILIGPPGAGKDTLGLALAGEYLSFIPGDHLRREVERGTVIGQEIQEEMQRGGMAGARYVPGLAEAFVTANPRRSYLFNGFPRSVEQAQFLADLLARLGFLPDNIHVIMLDVSDRVARERVVRRHQRAVAGTEKPRADDEDGALRRRLDVYRRYSEELAGYYGPHLQIVDAERPFAEVLGQVSAIIGTPASPRQTVRCAGLIAHRL